MSGLLHAADSFGCGAFQTAPSGERSLMVHTPLGPGAEFDAIREMVRRWGAQASGIGDDAAVLAVPEGDRLVVSTDCVIEGVHFRRDWLSAREIGYRATVAALSDLAAMAAEPLGMLVAIGVPESWRAALGELAEGIGDAATLTHAPILGGNTARAGELSVTITVLGSTAAPLTRAGALPGDRVFVTGRLGAPLAALRTLQAGGTPDAAHRERFARPVPRIREARWLATSGARAGLDISDGLLADVRHMAAASGVRILLDLERLPSAERVATLEAAESGEEYELVVAAPEPLDSAAFAREFGIPLTEIGVVAAGEPEPGVETRFHGERVACGSGHDHFSS